MTLRFGVQRLPVVVVAILALASAADAETLTYGVDAGLGESDNVRLAPTDKLSQTIGIADVDFDFKQLSPRLDADAKGNFSFLDYLQGAYGNQVIGRFDGVTHLAIIPERFNWVFQDDFGQATVDPFTPTTPYNLENINYFSTGPDFALRPGGTSFINVSARYARAQYETTPFNSNRFLGSFAWGLQLSASSSVSLNADSERVLFVNTALNQDFDRTNGFVRYELQGARTELSADLGATTVSQGGTSTAGGLGRVQLARKLSAAGKVTLSLGHDLTDASTSFSSLQSGAIGFVGTAPAPVSSASYKSNYAALGWQYERHRTIIKVSARWEEDTYGGQPTFDNNQASAEFSVERKLTRAFNAQIVGRFYKADYIHAIVSPTSGSPNFHDALIAAVLSWRHGRALEVRLRCEHNSHVTPGSDLGYGENRAILTIGYRPRPPEPAEEPGA
jgi:hypothetical protein